MNACASSDEAPDGSTSEAEVRVVDSATWVANGAFQGSSVDPSGADHRDMGTVTLLLRQRNENLSPQSAPFTQSAVANLRVDFPASMNRPAFVRRDIKWYKPSWVGHLTSRLDADGLPEGDRFDFDFDFDDRADRVTRISFTIDGIEFSTETVAKIENN